MISAKDLVFKTTTETSLETDSMIFLFRGVSVLFVMKTTVALLATEERNGNSSNEKRDCNTSAPAATAIMLISVMIFSFNPLSKITIRP